MNRDRQILIGKLIRGVSIAGILCALLLVPFLSTGAEQEDKVVKVVDMASRAIVNIKTE